MKQKEQVILAMKNNGGYATLQQLNQMVDVSNWATKTPYASIRRIVQTNKEFFKLKPGLWALTDCEQDVLSRFSIVKGDKGSDEIFTHGYYQGMLVEIGNYNNYRTYIPAQDKNRKFLDKPLSEMVTLPILPEFTYEKILKRAKTVDVIWFNERLLPFRFYEVEHSTDIRNSLDKFYELQDFRADYYIIADEIRRRQFNDIIKRSIYSPIKEFVKFFSYEKLAKQYEFEYSIGEKL